ncbi:hypothetical protein BVRB_035860, partial [Beta vulgaris subsp. vulgaris]
MSVCCQTSSPLLNPKLPNKQSSQELIECSLQTDRPRFMQTDVKVLSDIKPAAKYEASEQTTQQEVVERSLQTDRPKFKQTDVIPLLTVEATLKAETSRKEAKTQSAGCAMRTASTVIPGLPLPTGRSSCLTQSAVQILSVIESASVSESAQQTTSPSISNFSVQTLMGMNLNASGRTERAVLRQPSIQDLSFVGFRETSQKGRQATE